MKEEETPSPADYLYDYAFELYTKADKNIYEIRKLLIEKGLSQEAADKLAREVEYNVEIETKERGKKEIRNGAIALAAGSLVTFLSYSKAVDAGGGLYIVKIGAIIWGVVLLFRGAYRLSS